MRKALFILGPTATGKSQLALSAALQVGGPIINADSVQIYKGLKIGSALPTAEDMSIAPHHLYAYVDKGSERTAAQYVEDVRQLLGKKALEETVIICGGSGFYVQALEKGMFQAPQPDAPARERIENWLGEMGWEKAHAWLMEKDPSLQKTIHLNDHYRIRRAVEIILSTGKTPSELQRELTASPLKDFKIMKLALYAEKDLMLRRVQERVEKMLEKGFIEEVQGLIRQGHEDWAPLSSVGYKEIAQHLRGEITAADLAARIVTSHMQLIKKQLTWFKRDPTIQWIHLGKMGSAKDLIGSFC